jgi:hypothetical protein
MLDTRRGFLKNFTAASSSLLLFQSSPPIPTPRRRTEVDPPAAEDQRDTEKSAGESTPSRRAQLQAQEKEFRDTMTRLFNRVSDLKLQVDATRTTEIFSVAIFKQTQEIEKLAKQLKNSAKA